MGGTRVSCAKIRGLPRSLLLSLRDKHRILALVSDVGMQGRDGMAVMRDVRQLRDPAKRRIPAIALTGLVRLEDRESAIAAGFQTHLTKPVTAADLVASVLAALESGRTIN